MSCRRCLCHLDEVKICEIVRAERRKKAAKLFEKINIQRSMDNQIKAEHEIIETAREAELENLKEIEKLKKADDIFKEYLSKKEIEEADKEAEQEIERFKNGT